MAENRSIMPITDAEIQHRIQIIKQVYFVFLTMMKNGKIFFSYPFFSD